MLALEKRLFCACAVRIILEDGRICGKIGTEEFCFKKPMFVSTFVYLTSGSEWRHNATGLINVEYSASKQICFILWYARLSNQIPAKNRRSIWISRFVGSRTAAANDGSHFRHFRNLIRCDLLDPLPIIRRGSGPKMRSRCRKTIGKQRCFFCRLKHVESSRVKSMWELKISGSRESSWIDHSRYLKPTQHDQICFFYCSNFYSLILNA